MAKSPENIAIDQLDKDQMKTFSDFLMSYNRLSEMCFTDCVRDFTSRDVKENEEKCSLNCMEKYLKMNQRVSQRFQEFQMIANENALAMVKKTGN
ncbi:mitochondrial import inner membrane translocase subunit Tim9 [Drosophila guanche]|uniref:Mitochondrial import inner membrane translocase subunit n=2 Tax=Drosophila guanche TaxID=7266 RepID=A0A3B0K5B6_DROGU|nr:mitochondrial import inner membrane translocase subunit Tim9 [Drosophila guanche]XP_034123659.1 mitochondrial import inner membrane translocase subunit Tim9 [Drosophila guanche]SPP78658.1 blast:Mitochondrial import inner membrane translocase subunit Tim9 [Drosophila guanche]